MKRRYLKDKLMMIAAELEQVTDELLKLSAEFDDEDPVNAVKVDLPPEDR